MGKEFFLLEEWEIFQRKKTFLEALNKSDQTLFKKFVNEGARSFGNFFKRKIVYLLKKVFLLWRVRNFSKEKNPLGALNKGDQTLFKKFGNEGARSFGNFFKRKIVCLLKNRKLALRITSNRLRFDNIGKGNSNFTKRKEYQMEHIKVKSLLYSIILIYYIQKYQHLFVCLVIQKSFTNLVLFISL